MGKKDPVSIRKHFLFLGLIPSLLFLAFAIISLSWMQEVHLTNAAQSNLNSAYHLFYGELYEEAKMINAVVDSFSKRTEVQEAYQTDDRERLLAVVKPIFGEISATHEITHCYFHSPEKIVFLRVHYPDLFTDEVNRFTLNEAERTGSVTYGLELGVLGSLTLRVVMPWLVDGELVGYLEMGKEINGILGEIKKILEVDLIAVVDNKLLNGQPSAISASAEAEGGESAAGWDRSAEVAVVGMTMVHMPPIIGADLVRPHQEHEDLIVEFNDGGRKYLAGFAPLFDAADRDIGDIIIITDFSELEKVERRISQMFLVGYLFCILFYLAMIIIYLRRTKLRIKHIFESG